MPGFFRRLFAEDVKAAPATGMPAVELESMTLYHSPLCPFCMKVHHSLARQNIHLHKKNVAVTQGARQELIEGGGKSMVPCLRIHNADGDTWLYESDDIIAFLTQQASKERQALGV